MTDALDDAARLMLDNHVHRLVAVDDVGHPVGVLSSIDFVALYAEARS
jgi:CBS domain-containing protein